MNDESPENDQWKLGNDEEMRKAAELARRPPLTVGRVGEVVGGTVGLVVGVGVCIAITMMTPGIDFFWSTGIVTGCLFGGAVVGKSMFSSLKKKNIVKAGCR